LLITALAKHNVTSRSVNLQTYARLLREGKPNREYFRVNAPDHWPAKHNWKAITKHVHPPISQEKSVDSVVTAKSQLFLLRWPF
jgi:hypothetical protein